VKVGVIAYQGSFEEHAIQLKRAMSKLNLTGEVIAVKKPKDVDLIDGVVIPGGESTTIGIIAEKLGVLDEIKAKINAGLPVLGTCAGAIMLAKDVSDAKVGKKSQPLIGTMDIQVVRNYYGRQRESFETDLDFRVIGGGKARVVFIRAPIIKRTWNDATALISFENGIVMAEQKNMLATTFHPELSESTIVHEYFLSKIKK